MRKPVFLSLTLSLMICISVSAQQADSAKIEHDNISSRFKISAGGDLGYSTPQKYGAGAGVYLGEYTTEIIKYDSLIARKYYAFKGVNLHASLFRGGYKFGVYYFDYDSFIGPVGFKAGPVYYMNNSYSSVMKRRDMIGIEAEFTVIFRVKTGILREVDGNRFIPTLGFGFQIGPRLYEYD